MLHERLRSSGHLCVATQTLSAPTVDYLLTLPIAM